MEEIQNRRSIRLKGYDYSLPGDYFVTINTVSPKYKMSVIADYSVHLTKIGELVQNELFELENRYDVAIEKFVIMPDHIHFILHKNTGEKTLGNIVGAFKSLTVSKIWKLTGTKEKFWQRDYYDVILDSQKLFDQRVEYIENNPMQWQLRAENSVKFEK